MAGKNAVSVSAASMAVHWVGNDSFEGNVALPRQGGANRWQRVMRATPGYKNYPQSAFGSFCVCMDSFEFLLRQAAATLIPVVVALRDADQTQRGAITDVYRDGGVLCVRGTTLNLRMDMDEITQIRVQHRSTTGSPSVLEVCDARDRRLALFYCELDYRLAWHALIGWLLLREAEGHAEGSSE